MSKQYMAGSLFFFLTSYQDPKNGTIDGCHLKRLVTNAILGSIFHSSILLLHTSPSDRK